MSRESELKQTLADFTTEVTFERPDWVRDRRVEYLTGLVIKLLKQQVWWAKQKLGVDYWDEAIQEAVIEPEQKKMMKLLREIELYQSPKPINYDDRLTDSDIERAKEVPLDIVSGLNFRSAGGGRMKACCPFHDEKTPSFVWYVEQNNYHCYGCGDGGDVISYLIKRDNLTFKQAVKKLI